jgi:hypothetical protein
VLLEGLKSHREGEDHEPKSNHLKHEEDISGKLDTDAFSERGA